jgi:phosphohistidine phosphatase
MKKLLLVRHGKSSWDNPDIADHERPLTTRGKESASTIGKFLKKEDLIPDLIISSTAKRANKTADIIGKKSSYNQKILESEALYSGSSEDYTNIIHEIADKNKTVLLVGHNPVIEDVVERITAEKRIMKTCSLAHIDLSIDSWKNFHYRKKYKLVALINVRELDIDG